MYVEANTYGLHFCTTKINLVGRNIRAIYNNYKVSHPLVQLGFIVFFFMSSKNLLGQRGAAVLANQQMEDLKNYTTI